MALAASSENLPRGDVALADAGALLADAAGHAADALPELITLARRATGCSRAPARTSLNEIIHCLGSALEAVLIVSEGLPDGARRAGEDTLAEAVRSHLDQDVA